MAVEHETPVPETTKVLEIAELVKQLEAKWGVAPVQPLPKGLLQDPRTVTVDLPRFDKTFFVHLSIGVGLFALTTVCFAFQIPVLGDPLALLVAPAVTIYLSWKHRQPRQLNG